MAKKRKSLKTLKRNAKDIFSECIRRRDKGVCCTCSKKFDWKYEGDAGHWIPKTNTNWGTRFDERNVHFQCIHCNRFSHPQDEYAEFMLQKYGRKVMNELRKQKHWSLVKFVTIKLAKNVNEIPTNSREAYEFIIKYYSEKLEKLK